MGKIITKLSGFEDMGYSEYRFILGVNVTKLSEMARSYGNQTFAYLRGADIVDFVRAHERAVRSGRNGR